MAHLISVHMAGSWHQQSKHVPAVAHFQRHHFGQSWCFVAEASYCQLLKLHFWGTISGEELQISNNLFCMYAERTSSGGQHFQHLLCHWWVLIDFLKVIITADTLTSPLHWLSPLPTSCKWHGTPADDMLSNRKWTTLYKNRLRTTNSPPTPF